MKAIKKKDKKTPGEIHLTMDEAKKLAECDINTISQLTNLLKRLGVVVDV